MAYDEKLADRVREIISVTQKNVEEKKMFGGLCFMVNGKMCIGVEKDKLMCRIDPLFYEDALEKDGCREMDFTGKPMKGYVYIDEDGFKKSKDLQYWVGLCLDFNKKAKKSKKAK